MMYSCREQVDIVHVAAIGYFDELVQPTYTLSTQNQATGLWACLAMLVTLTVNTNNKQLLQGDVNITSVLKELILVICDPTTPDITYMHVFIM